MAYLEPVICLRSGNDPYEWCGGWVRLLVCLIFVFVFCVFLRRAPPSRRLQAGGRLSLGSSPPVLGPQCLGHVKKVAKGGRVFEKGDPLATLSTCAG